MVLQVKTSVGNYDVTVQTGGLARAGETLSLRRRVLIVSDDGVPEKYVKTLEKQCLHPVVVRLPMGEATKNLDSWQFLLKTMLENDFSRKDCVAAVGGGVVGDLAGFAAACYMRGLDFYNLPTTLLSQVDSSIGGKTAVDFASVKNIVGAFYPPKAVFIDPQTLQTLPHRQISAGMAESVKMALTFDRDFFAFFENGDPFSDPARVIVRSLELKKAVVEEDEREQGLRKALNFGHTLGHGIESAKEPELLHGECVAMGMLPMCAAQVRSRLLPVLEKLGLPVSCDFDLAAALKATLHDKKATQEGITAVFVPEVGSFTFRTVNEAFLKGAFDSLEKRATR